jgi:Rps23 Pro-64 3,4-dihydroxylase Tpa1-like proline 4-hydroxylase
MNLIEANESLHTNGYCDFDLKDFSEESYNAFLELKYKVSDDNYLEKFTIVRFDAHDENHNSYRINEGFETFKNAIIEKNNLIKKYDENKIAQIWLQSEMIPFSDNSIIKQTYYQIIKHFYNQTEDDVNCALQWTCYSEGCYLKDHNDGQGDEYQNTCAVLIYLNEEWEEDWGGSLILRNTKNTHSIDKETKYKIAPKFGKVAIIDLQTFDTSHAVEKIIGEHNRCTLLAFATQRKKRKDKLL